jgi:uncharacterized protein (TIGR03437 family)
MIMKVSSFLIFVSVIAAQTATAQIQVAALKSSAGFTAGLPFPGSLAAIGLTGLTGIQGIQSAAALPLPYEIAGVSVLVGGAPAPLLAVADMGWYQQINIQVPEQFQSPQTVEVSQAGQTGQLNVDVYNTLVYGGVQWGVFFDDGTGQGVLQHADYSLVTSDHPAQPGEVIIAYCSNLAPYSDVVNAPAIGYPAQASPLPSLSPTRSLWTTFAILLVNNQTAEILYAGLTPYSTGLFQINFRVPAGTADGDAVVMATTDNSSCFGAGSFCPDLKRSQSVTLPVRMAEAQ